MPGLSCGSVIMRLDTELVETGVIIVDSQFHPLCCLASLDKSPVCLAAVVKRSGWWAAIESRRLSCLQHARLVRGSVRRKGPAAWQPSDCFDAVTLDQNFRLFSSYWSSQKFWSDIQQVSGVTSRPARPIYRLIPALSVWTFRESDLICLNISATECSLC